MSNGTAITEAVVNVTIGSITWDLHWNGSASLYQIQFNGTDSPPGFGINSIQIKAEKYGYVSFTENRTLDIRKEETYLSIAWIGGPNITYINSTILTVDYYILEGPAILLATVNVTIGFDTWDLIWDPINLDYRIQFNGTDSPPGFGTFDLTIKAEKFGHSNITDRSQDLFIQQEQTDAPIVWSAPSTNNVSYLEDTTLIVVYRMSNQTAIEGATVNVTIVSTIYQLYWNSQDQWYEMQFNGTDVFPGYGTHQLKIQADKFGYDSWTDNTTLTIRMEDTFLSVYWFDSSDISYVQSTVLAVDYYLRDNSDVLNAAINVSINGEYWNLIYNPGSGYYELMFNGTDDPPGFDNHSLTVSAWKANYQTQANSTLYLNIEKEDTSLVLAWSDGDEITYVGTTILSANYTMSNGTVITGADVSVRIASTTWSLHWNGTLYVIQFNGTDTNPGIGTHSLNVTALKFGYVSQITLLTLKITGELGEVQSIWLNGDTITFLDFTILSVNYTMSNGTAIPNAIVNVTISATHWNLTWHAPSQTYRIQFNGTDIPPGLGTHNLVILAWRSGFDRVTDSSMCLTINDANANFAIVWSLPYLDNISYFQYTTLRVSYTMDNGSDIVSAVLNVTIDTNLWQLHWNATSGYYEIRFNGTDILPGFGTHSLLIVGDVYGFHDLLDISETLILRKDPTSIQVVWQDNFNITYVEQTKLQVIYRMSNGTAIPDALVNITIDGQPWDLTWNSTSGAYEKIFLGTDSSPGLGEFLPLVVATGNDYVAQSILTRLVIREEQTTAIPNWWSDSLYYHTGSSVIEIEFRDSYGSLITGATQRIIYINGTPQTLTEGIIVPVGVYWYQLDGSWGLGYHTIEVNISKDGYEFSFVDSIHFNITENPTEIVVTWSSTSIDYIDQSDLTVQYIDTVAVRNIESGMVTANVSIDGAAPVSLTPVGNLWTANFTGISLDLGSHDIVIRVWAFGYEYQENYTLITVGEVVTNPLTITWEYSNVTIQYIESLNLTLDYTYYGGDVPDSASVNVTIDGTTYDLLYSGGTWSVSIPGDQIGIGVYNAYISAWLYGYAAKTNLTSDVNVTLAANSFIVNWEPVSGELSYVDDVNISVVYTHDYVPITDATVILNLNESSPLSLAYSAVDQMWHVTLSGAAIGLGVWNATIVANRTGHLTGTEWKLLNITRDMLQISTNWTTVSIDYISDQALLISCNASNGVAVLDASIYVEVNSILFPVYSEGGGFYSVTLGPMIDLGTHDVNLTISGSWFQTKNLILSITILPTSSILAYDISNAIIFFDQAVSGTVNYTLLNGTAIAGANYKVLAGGIPITGTMSEPSWLFTILGDVLGIGTHSCSINITSFGYEAQYYQFSITVNEIPTEVSISGREWGYVNDTMNIMVRYIDTRDNSTIVASSFIVTWAGDSGLEETPSGAYSLVLGSMSLNAGNYSLTLNLSTIGFGNAISNLEIEVRPLPLTIITGAPITQYEQEVVSIYLYIVDEYHSTNVTWATVKALFQEVEYALAYNPSIGFYTVSILLTVEEIPGEYGILLIANGTNLVSTTGSVQLTVIEKTSYSLTVSLPEEIATDSDIPLSVTMFVGTTPASGRSITIWYNLTFANGRTEDNSEMAQIGSDGIASIQIHIQVDVIQLNAWATFDGAIDAWSVTSDTVHVEVDALPTETTGIVPPNPLTLTIVTGSSVGLIVVLILVRKRRSVGIGATSISTATTTLPISSLPDSHSTSAYRMTTDGVVNVPDIVESLSEVLDIAPEEVPIYESFIAGAGIATTISISTRSKKKQTKNLATDDALRVRELLRKAREGMTRAEISEALNINIRKVRDAVKELLESDESIIEIKDGKRRKVLFKP